MEGCEDSRCQARETRMEGCEDSRCARAVGSYKAAGKQAYGRMRTDGGQKRGLAYTMNHRKRGREEERKRGQDHFWYIVMVIVWWWWLVLMEAVE